MRHDVTAGRRRLLATAALLAAISIVPAAPASAASGTLAGHFRGNAWAADANIKAGEVSIRLGRAAYQPCPCPGTDGQTRSNHTADIGLPGVVHVDETRATANASKSARRTAKAVMKAQVSGLDLLDGTITAAAVTGVARVDATTSAISLGSGGSRFAGLRILGRSYAADVRPNTRITLPDIGYVVLREESRTGSGSRRRALQVTMIRVRITDGSNAFDLPVGAEIRIAQARVAYDRDPIRVEFRGTAFGSASANDAGPLSNRLGRSGVVYLGCEGTKGKWRSNSASRVKVGQLISAGDVVNRVRSTLSDGVGRAIARSEVQSVDLGGTGLGSLVRLTGLEGVAKATWDRNADKGSVSSGGSRFATLSVAGLDIPIDVPPNTKVTVPGLGELTLYERSANVTATQASIRVAMLHLKVGTNLLGIPSGTDLLVGVARATAKKP